MTNLAQLSEHDTTHRLAVGEGGREDGRLTAILMDDNRFDRRLFGRTAQKSNYDVDLIETASIAETRVAVREKKADVIFLDFRVPDGDGIHFAGELRQTLGRQGPPMIIVTGDGDEDAAIRSMRSGAVDYLRKSELSVERFDATLENALQQNFSVGAEMDHAATHAELAALRRKTAQNMHLARAYMLPIAMRAWQWVGGLPDEQKQEEAQQLAQITRHLTGFLDETLVHATTECRDVGPDVVNIYDAALLAIELEPLLQDCVRLGNAANFPLLKGRWGQFVKLFGILFSDILSQMPGRSDARIDVDATTDADGNLLLCVRDNGPSLSDRQAMLRTSNALGGQGHAPAMNSMSVCQRIAEMNGGKFRIGSNGQGGCVMLFQFPQSLVLQH